MKHKMGIFILSLWTFPCEAGTRLWWDVCVIKMWQEDEMKVAPLGGKIKADTLLYRIHKNSDQLQNEQKLFYKTAAAVTSDWTSNFICVTHLDLSSLGWDALVGMKQAARQSPRPPCPPVWRWDFSAVTSRWRFGWKGGFSLLFALQWRCWRLGTLTPVRADFQLGACSPSERAQVQVQPDLDHGGLIIQRKPQVFLTLGF